MDLPDVRRTVHIENPAPAQEILNALRKVAGDVGGQYKEEIVRDVDGAITVQVGIHSIHPSDIAHPYPDVILRTGENLSTTEIELGQDYSTLGVGSHNWPSSHHYSRSYTHQQAVVGVEAVRDSLEAILK
tara:strand:+ start:8310 stop:8699 length:390 start_codon:yes stop_codon:yes gene_type:complete